MRQEEQNQLALESYMTQMLKCIDPNPTRGGLVETPERVAKAWIQTWASGYGKDPKDVLKTFSDGGEKYDQAISVVNIPVYSKCEHHLADIFGTATISYIPNGRIVGLSKLSRVLDIYARRLQVQERLTAQVAESIQEHLKPKGVGVMLRCRHLCMESRGVSQQGHYTVTTALRGVMLDDASARAEFLMVANQAPLQR
jgi:GTP cyclohydrolase I